MKNNNQDLIEYLDEKLDILGTILVIFFLAVFVVLFVVALENKADAFELTSRGIEFSAGGFSQDAIGTSDINHDFNWFSMGLFAQYSLAEKWDGVVAVDVGALRWSGKNGYSDKATESLGLQLILYRDLFKNVSIGLGGGFAGLRDTQDIPELGNSGLYGTITGRVKVKLSERYGIEFAADHISDAVQDDDAGNNVFALKFYLMLDAD